MINNTPRAPRSDTETIERLGAQWDATKGQRSVREGHDAAPFAIWLPPEIPDDGLRLPVDVVLLPDRCYRCGSSTAPVVGIWFEHQALDGYEYGMLEESGGWFLMYDETSADVIAKACSDDLLAAHGAGPLCWRTTRFCPDGYLANTCQHCRTVLGNWPLREAFAAYQAELGSLEELPRFASAVMATALQKL